MRTPLPDLDDTGGLPVPDDCVHVCEDDECDGEDYDDEDYSFGDDMDFTWWEYEQWD